MSNVDLATRLFMQIVVIMLTCRAISYIGNRCFRQTKVVCEMISGVLLGPSFLGILLPEFQSFLFPKDPMLLADGMMIPNPSMSILYICSQLGIMFYMFVAGLDFNTNLIKRNIKSGGLISLSGIIVPFFFSTLFLVWLPDSFGLFENHFALGYRILFLGLCLSITALPILARILEDNKISKTKFGTIALAAGTLDDICAWILLAIFLALVKDDISICLIATLGTVLFVILLLLVRGMLNSCHMPEIFNKKKFSLGSFSTVIIILMICALFTEKIGIYLVFGSFLAGIMIPRGEFTAQIRGRIIDLVQLVFLPIFFVFSGLNTQIGLLNSISLWEVTVGILLIAILGKGVACAIVARISGETWAESTTIGALMNTRGLMELIAINIGLQEKIITPTLYTILVLMAIITTLLASPIYYWVMKPKTF